MSGMDEHSWQFYLSGGAAWEAMLEACEAARVSIDLEQFIFEYDGIGRRFYHLFLKKARAGVRVRLLLDSGGSYSFFNSLYHEELSRQGVEVEVFSPISPWRIHNFSSFFFRDHRKILVVDGRRGFTGGAGIEDRQKEWRDTVVDITGPAASEMSRSFELMWQTVKTGRYQKVKLNDGAQGEFDFLINSPRFRQRHLYYEFLRRTRAAKKYIYFTAPYFVPSQRLFFYLNRAARRGVDVRLLLPDNSDHDMVGAASRSFFDLLLHFGAKIYLYPSEKNLGRMLHAKTGVIDDVWATVGSSNFDNLSFVYNYEANLVSTNADFIKEIKQQFYDDLKTAAEVKAGEFRKRGRLAKFYELLTWPFHGIL